MVKFREWKIATFLAFLLCAPLARAEIRETSSMAEALSYAGPNTLVVLDLDNTVMETAQMLGSDPFFGLLVDAAHGLGIQGDDAIQWALERNGLVQPESRVRPVEAQTPEWIQELQARGVRVMGLTSRPGLWAHRTIRQVESLGISLRVTAPIIESSALPSGQMQEGIFFLNPGKAKGPAMIEFLHLLGSSPESIVFVDDKASHTKSMEAALSSSTIPHTSFRYGAADERVRAFNPEIARCQWNLFLGSQVFVSDQDALEAIREKRCDSGVLGEPYGTNYIANIGW